MLHCYPLLREGFRQSFLRQPRPFWPVVSSRCGLWALSKPAVLKDPSRAVRFDFSLDEGWCHARGLRWFVCCQRCCRQPKVKKHPEWGKMSPTFWPSVLDVGELFLPSPESCLKADGWMLTETQNRDQKRCWVGAVWDHGTFTWKLSVRCV